MTVRRTPKQTSAYKSQEVREYEKTARQASIARKRRAFTRLVRSYKAAERISVQCK